MVEAAKSPRRKIVLVGNPNVGKSVVFRLLTGRYAVVSNYPGTTIEVSRGEARLEGLEYEVLDTPGVNSLVPESDDERVTCEILIREDPDCIVQVADAKNLRRSLLVTSQLVEFGKPTILILNMMDEAADRGIRIDSEAIARLFGIPVFESVAVSGEGLSRLSRALALCHVPRNPLPAGEWMNEPIASSEQLQGLPLALALEWIGFANGSQSHKAEAALGRQVLGRLNGAATSMTDLEIASLAGRVAEQRSRFLDFQVDRLKLKKKAPCLEEARDNASLALLALLILGTLLFAWIEIGGLLGLPNPYGLAEAFLEDPVSLRVEEFLKSSGLDPLQALLLVRDSAGKVSYGLIPEFVRFLLIFAPVILPLGLLVRRDRRFAEKLGVLSRRRLTGVPILLGVLLLIYEFVGYTGAQTLVGWIEDGLFGTYLIPLVQSLLPAGFFYDLLVGRYGLISMGLSYSIAIVLPVVGTFFLAFSLLEDSGYLPRLSILSDRVMRAMGLNGRAVLPLVLGFGCCTMATMTTRILPTRKERLIATILLALGIPCSAQLGVILGIAAGFSSRATLAVIAVVASQLVWIGYLSSKLIKGERSSFLFEIPPIRVPQLRNIALKTGYRVRWYVKEAVPLFLYGTLFLFVIDRLHAGGRSILGWIEHGLEPVLSGLLHLPAEAAAAFVLGFLRRDYGAAGLFEMTRSGMLSAEQAVVSLIVITLFVPCVASFLVIVKEQGLARALAITGFIIPYAIAVGTAVSWVLRTFQVSFT